MRRLTVLATIAVLLALAPAATAASRGSAWKQVLRKHGVTSASERIVVRPGRFRKARVGVVIHARRTNVEPVLFGDPLYGATAWRWKKRRWRRVDTAQVRPAVVRELEPGRSTRVRLPLRRRFKRVRVLVPVTADRAGAWVDVRR